MKNQNIQITAAKFEPSHSDTQLTTEHIAPLPISIQISLNIGNKITQKLIKQDHTNKLKEM